MHTTMIRLYEVAKIIGINGQTELAKALNESPQTINNWEMRGISSRGLINACLALKCNANWVQSGQGDKFLESNAEPAMPIGTFKRVAVVGTAQLGDDGYWAELEYPVGHGDGYVEYATKDHNAYALRCKGDSMKPRIKNDEFVIIEPGHEPISGDEVMAKCKSGKVMVKELLYTREGIVYLGSVNEAHGKLAIPLEELESLHYVAAIVKRHYWKPE